MASIPFDIRELLESVADELREDARRRRVSLIGFKLPDFPRRAKGDRDKLRQVLHMLTAAAVEADTDSDICILASHYPFVEELPGWLTVRFSVSATIDESKWAPSSAPVAPIIRELGSSLTMLGGHSHGSEAYFLIPLKLSVARASRVCLTPSLAALRTFIVSNEPPPNRAISNYLRCAGMRCDGAPSAEEALIEISRQTSEGSPYDLIFVATPIPDASHLGLIESLRASDIGRTPVVHVDRYYDEHEEKRSLRAGFTEYMSKPFGESQLIDVVARLSGHDISGGLSSAPPVVLIAEDNLVNQKVLAFQLRRLGVDSDVVPDGQQALDALEHNDYCLVLLDLQMPNMDGFETITRIRRNPKWQTLPVIAVTANADEDTKNRCLQLGMSDFIGKPASLEKIKNTLMRHCRVPEQAFVSSD